MADKSEKTKARLPRGFADRSAEDIRAVEKMMATIRSVYELYGFEPVDQPMIEYTDALGKFLPDQDRPNEGVFSFQDDDDQWLSLRYDLTAPTARFVAENFDKLPKPYRSYRSGWVFRNEKPGPGRFRQFMQFDADTIGTPGVAADAEMAMMMADVMEALGLKGRYVVRINNRKVLDGLLDTIKLSGPENAGRRLALLRSIDKLDRLGVSSVLELLTTGRTDESGDRTQGVGLSSDAAKKVLNFVTGEGEVWSDVERFAQPTRDEWILSRADLQTFTKLKDAGPERYFYNSRRLVENWMSLVGSSETGKQGVEELQTILSIIEAAGYGSNRIRIDPSVVRGLEYYTGPVFEAELLAEIPNDEGQIVRFGSVGGGGRYDGLVSRFRGEPVPATGFS
ncbi:histidine--tRNA ligase, partial [Mesorhizobium sp.]|uniref:histidine--tRNA ligase n=1 Tax=Mesorhizobium sp. TaxID=1871066 RepID=UPI00345C60F9